MSYSQFGDDEFLLSLFESEYKGVCIEVGSAQPIYGNNTYLLEKQGWKIYCIEPNPKLVDRLKPLRKNVFQYAIGNENSEKKEFTICTLSNGNQEAISSLKLDNKLIETHEQYNPTFEKINVKVRKLETFINENEIQNIDIISIDTEGTELDVLKGLNLYKNRPKVFVIENNFESKLLRYYMSAFGYRHINRLGVNDFFVREKDSVNEVFLNYSTTGNIGDLFHELYVVKNYYKQTGLKGNIFLKNKEHHLDGTFVRDLYDISTELNNTLKLQEYFNGCYVYNSMIENVISLDSWRRSEFLYNKCWTEMLCNVYEIDLPIGTNSPWIEQNTINENYKNKVVIHQSTERKTKYFPWENIIDNNECIFISFEERQYNEFQHREKVPLVLMKNFEECISILQSCKFYVGNLTSITALSHCLQIPRLLEFEVFRDNIHVGDYIHNQEELKYSDNYFYYSDNLDVRHINGISKYLKGLE